MSGCFLPVFPENHYDVRPGNSICPQNRKSHRITGFTLIEVSLSLAIVAVAVIPVIALLSAGLTTNRQSTDTAITSQIVDQVGREIEQADFSTLPNQIPTTFFNDQGVKVEKEDPFKVFDARVTITKNVELPSEGGTQVSHNLARILIDVAANPTNKPESEIFEEDGSGALVQKTTHRFTLFVSRND